MELNENSIRYLICGVIKKLMKGFCTEDVPTVVKAPIYWKSGGTPVNLNYSLNTRMKKSWRLSKTSGNVKD